MLPTTIPIFPLPNVVLFPNVFLPLHIFEPRYRAMLADALAGDRIIGMTLLMPGYEADYEGRPAVYRVGCAGVITHSERLPRRTFERGAALESRSSASSRRTPAASTAWRASRRCPRSPATPRKTLLKQRRHRLEALLVAAIERGGQDPRFPSAIPDEDLVNALSQYLGLDPVERQALLERDGILARCDGPDRAAGNEDLLPRRPEVRPLRSRDGTESGEALCPIAIPYQSK
jgi:Lon protease-like protein